VTAHLLLLLLTAAPVAAPGDDPGWRVSAEVMSEVPLHLGAGVAVEGPYRIRVDSSVGYLPGFYVDGMNAVLKAIPDYDEDIARLVKLALESSLIWRTHVGWRPFESAGLFFSAGYGLVALGGGAGTEALLVAGSMVASPVGLVPAGLLPEVRGYDVSSTLHMLDLEVGWELPLNDDLFMRAALGGAFTVASSTEISPRFTLMWAAQTAVEQFTGDTESFLNDVYRSYVHSPVLSVSVGYRFN